jgi:hypothetical protein
MTEWVHIRSIGVVLQIPQDNVKPTEKGLISWVDHVELKYDTILIISMYYMYTAYMTILWNEMGTMIFWCMCFFYLKPSLPYDNVYIMHIIIHQVLDLHLYFSTYVLVFLLATFWI